MWRYGDRVRHIYQQGYSHHQTGTVRPQLQECLPPQQPVGAEQHRGEEGLANLLRGGGPLPMAAQDYQEKAEVTAESSSSGVSHIIMVPMRGSRAKYVDIIYNKLPIDMLILEINI